MNSYNGRKQVERQVQLIALKLQQKQKSGGEQRKIQKLIKGPESPGEAQMVGYQPGARKKPAGDRTRTG